MPFLQCLLKIKYTRKTPGWRRATAMLTIAVSVRRGNFEKFVLPRFHVRFSKQLTLIAPVTLTAKTGECYVIKRFLLENPGFLPGFRIFPDFFQSKAWVMSCRFRKTKFHKNILRNVGGVSKHAYAHTHNIGDLYINKNSFVNRRPVRSLEG